MWKNIIIVVFVMACLWGESAFGGRLSNYGNRNYYGSQVYPQTSTQKTQTAKEYLDNKADISTFGIISLIFAIVVACLLFYYGIMCCPLFCQDQKKYRYMDGTSMITAATSPSIQSIERYPTDQKQ